MNRFSESPLRLPVDPIRNERTCAAYYEKPFKVGQTCPATDTG